jgi:hypothetical protein
MTISGRGDRYQKSPGTAIVRGVDGTGVGLVEVYEVATAP